MNQTCNELDDYLDDQMMPSVRAAFREHLKGCEACRGDVALRQNIYGLLHRATTELENPPRRLVLAIEARLGSVNRQQLRWRVSSAMAAAVLLIATTVWIANLLKRESMQPVAVGPQTGTEHEAESNHVSVGVNTVSTIAQVRVNLLFDAKHDTIALPVASDDPNVSIFWLYPIQSSAQHSSVPENESTEELPRSKT